MTTLPSIPPLEPAPLPPESRPAVAYLLNLAEGPGRVTMRSTLGRIAESLGFAAIDDVPWHELRREHVMALRSRWQSEFAPATVNKYLAAVRGVCREAWRSGLMDGETHNRIQDVSNVKGSRLPAGRALEGGELRALFDACADGSPAGARDAAAFALMFGSGLRRSEAAGVAVEHYDRDTGAIRILGKGNKERLVYATNGGKAALDAWLAIRGDGPGPVLCPVSKGGTVDSGASITAQSLMQRLKRRAAQAKISSCTPHDLRRTFVSAALEAGADLAMVQALAGHANPATTARYDRRPEAAKAKAAQLVHVPFAGA
ncbi:MAG: tyrosine-type recombinase/integrase [Boseongicola sp.]|nr:tyrosine-type recombinase/integrase [Boseongicola sp.]